MVSRCGFRVRVEMDDDLGTLAELGFILLRGVHAPATLDRMVSHFDRMLEADGASAGRRASRGHVYAARNLIDDAAEVRDVWRCQRLVALLHAVLGDRCGMVRALFFDKPPGRTWTLGWHRDAAIAVAEHRSPAGTGFSRPTCKAGVPHVIAPDQVLERMLTLRIHLDAMTSSNGALKVRPGSHRNDGSVSLLNDLAEPDDEVMIDCDRGDALAMRPRLLHASGSSHPDNQSHRRVLHLEFAADRDLPHGYRWRWFVPV